MGQNVCSGVRQKELSDYANEKWEESASMRSEALDKFNKSRELAVQQYNEKSKEYGPMLKQKQSEMGPMMDSGYHRWLLLKSQSLYGFDNQIPPGDDDATWKESKFRDLLLFEYYIMPLKQMSLHDFERRLKKLAYMPRGQEGNSAYGQEIVSLKQLQASFEDDIFMRAQLYDKDSIMFKLITDDLFHYKENQFDSGYDYGNEDMDKSVIMGPQKSPNHIILDERQQKIFDETLSQFDNLQLPDMDFEAGHIVETKFRIVNKE